LAHDEMDLWALARELRGEFHDHARPFRDALVENIQFGSVGDREGEMVQADIGAAVEGDSAVRGLDLPPRHDAVSIGHEHRWIIGSLADDTPPKAVAEELPRAREVANTQPNMVDAVREFICHQYPPSSRCFQINLGITSGPKETRRRIAVREAL